VLWESREERVSIESTTAAQEQGLAESLSSSFGKMAGLGLAIFAAGDLCFEYAKSVLRMLS
jgi:hypothetical protein